MGCKYFGIFSKDHIRWIQIDDIKTTEYAAGYLNYECKVIFFSVSKYNK